MINDGWYYYHNEHGQLHRPLEDGPAIHPVDQLLEKLAPSEEEPAYYLNGVHVVVAHPDLDDIGIVGDSGDDGDLSDDVHNSGAMADRDGDELNITVVKQVQHPLQ